MYSDNVYVDHAKIPPKTVLFHKIGHTKTESANSVDSVQSIEEITRIVEEAQKPPQGAADWDNDDYLDGALQQEDYQNEAVDEWGEPL